MNEFPEKINLSDFKMFIINFSFCLKLLLLLHQNNPLRLINTFANQKLQQSENFVLSCLCFYASFLTSKTKNKNSKNKIHSNSEKSIQTTKTKPIEQ